MSKQWHSPSNPADIQEKPWLSDEAITYLESILKPEMNVMEFGGGGSTLWMASRVRHVTTFENNPEWADAIREKAPDNVTVRDEIFEWDFGQYDLLFLDGEPVEQRGIWLLKAERLLKPRGWLVLDNANRPEYSKQRDIFRINADLKYTSPLQGKHLITEFWRMK